MNPQDRKLINHIFVQCRNMLFWSIWLNIHDRRLHHVFSCHAMLALSYVYNLFFVTKVSADLMNLSTFKAFCSKLQDTLVRYIVEPYCTLYTEKNQNPHCLSIFKTTNPSRNARSNSKVYGILNSPKMTDEFSRQLLPVWDELKIDNDKTIFA